MIQRKGIHVPLFPQCRIRKTVGISSQEYGTALTISNRSTYRTMIGEGIIKTQFIIIGLYFSRSRVGNTLCIYPGLSGIRFQAFCFPEIECIPVQAFLFIMIAYKEIAAFCTGG
ncbi:hypothetical protein D3C87_1311150 [compost metagenome]